MSSSGPGSVLVFLSFVILSSLLFGVYMTAYLGTIYAGEEVRREGEAAVEQAVIYLFQHPTNVSVVSGSPLLKGETRIAVQNVGPREISYDRILAIGKNGDVLADAKVPGDKGLGARQWQIYRVQELGLPDKWNNFTVFESEVSRIVLLSGRGRTHGSTWGVPPFLEGIFRVTISTATTASYYYSYITTTTFATTYTITIPPRQSGYSLTGEWLESKDGKAWYNVTNGFGRGTEETIYECHWPYFSERCGIDCSSYHRVGQNPTWSVVVSGMKANGERIVADLAIEGTKVECSREEHIRQPPGLRIIKHFRDGSQVTVTADITEYTLYWRIKQCWGYRCSLSFSEGAEIYRLQAIELVDWDTGEVYASVNQNSLTFNIHRNTIVRFKYVLVDRWSRSWEIVVPRSPPSPANCTEILNTRQPPDPEWCSCARQLLPESEWQACASVSRSCYHVGVSSCCSGDEPYACLESWNANGGSQCVDIREGTTATITVSWSASWSLKPGWALNDWGWSGDGSCSGSARGGSCTVTAESGRNYYATIWIVFKKV